MKLHPDTRSTQHIVTAYETGRIAINGRFLSRSLLLTPDHLDETWGPEAFAALTPDHLIQVAAFACDVVLIGTGQQQHFPPPALLRPLIDARRGFEIMDTAAACRTYNILVAEGRAVLAALIIEGGAP